MSVINYGAQIWAVNKKLRRKLKVTQTGMKRSMLNIEIKEYIYKRSLGFGNRMEVIERELG